MPIIAPNARLAQDPRWRPITPTKAPLTEHERWRGVTDKLRWPQEPV